MALNGFQEWQYISSSGVIKINFLHAKEHTETSKMRIIKNY
jgi:hypothetical protein